MSLLFRSSAPRRRRPAARARRSASRNSKDIHLSPIRKPERKRLETGKVVLDISMSLDGFIAGTNDGPTNPLGDGGMRLHDWLWGKKPKRAGVAPGQGATGSNREVIDELFSTTGAILTGRRTYRSEE